MDQLADDGQYHYRNPDLGFRVNLPSEFIYYQVQRKTTARYTEVEFFVPTSDTDYPQEVPSYAKPLVVRIYHVPDWAERLEAQANTQKYVIIGERDDKAYVLRFWDEIPEDWRERWNDNLKQAIIDSFNIQ